MVLLVPEVSKCSINCEKDVSLLSRTSSSDLVTKNNLSQLSHILQLNLETDKVLQSFFKHIKHQFKLTKLLYTNAEHDISLLLGSKLSCSPANSKHTQDFELYYQKEYLGTILLASKHKLSINKVFELKSYINYLILPLKNSLLYSQAVKATRTDALTKVGNRLSLVEDLNYHFNLSKRFNSPLSLVFIDIDFFKKINDRHGHIVGDKILITLSKFLKQNIRNSDVVYRYGGEEFVLILEKTNRKGAMNLAKKINNFIQKQNITISHKPIIAINVTISLGVATKTNEDSPESLMIRADQALYAAKAAGRNQFIYK